MKLIEVECPIHGVYEFWFENEQEMFCSEKINGKPCGERLTKLYTPPNVHYKGGGFYSTDKGD